MFFFFFLVLLLLFVCVYVQTNKSFIDIYLQLHHRTQTKITNAENKNQRAKTNYPMGKVGNNFIHNLFQSAVGICMAVQKGSPYINFTRSLVLPDNLGPCYTSAYSISFTSIYDQTAVFVRCHNASQVVSAKIPKIINQAVVCQLDNPLVCLGTALFLNK